MDAHRWQKIQQVFHEALDRDPVVRPSFLHEACGGDEALRLEVAALIEASEKVEGVFEQAIGGTLELTTEAAGESRGRIGPYRLIRELGRGGSGTVHLAERADDEYHMQVAIKLVRRGMDTQDILRRLRQERQILAGLDHPNIARLLDGGTSETGQPYFAMEYVAGEPVDLYCDHRRLSITERLVLFRRICSAVHYAHRNLVVHRDLKPSNILVAADGTPKLLDFGIAKVLRPDASPRTLVRTAPEVRLLTPEYASPEQVRGEVLTTAVDVYSLGVLLYRLLSGHPPYRFESDRPQEVERIVCEAEPEKPSAAISRDEEVWDSAGECRRVTARSVSLTREGSPERLRRRLRGDLDTVVLTALAKEPERRYGSVEQLSEDLRRHLAGLPLIARPGAPGYRLRKFISRHRPGVAATAAVVVLVAGLVAFYTVRLTRERDLAEQARIEAETSEAFLLDLIQSADPAKSKGESITVGDILEQGAERVEHLADQPERQASLMELMGNVYQSLGKYEPARKLLSGSLQVWRERFDEESPQVARAKTSLAGLLSDMKELEAAEKLSREALATQRGLLAEVHPDTAATLNVLAGVRFRQERLEDAENLLRECRGMWRRLEKEEDEEAVRCLHNLAVVLHDQGEIEEAQRLYEELRDLKRKIHGDVHPDIALLYFNLGQLREKRGQDSAALELFSRAHAMEIRLFGERYPRVYRSARYRARVLDRQGSTEEAEILYEKTLADIRQGPYEDFETVWLRQDFAALLIRQGDFRGAAELLREALEIHRRSGLSRRCWIAEAEASLAVSLILMRRFEEAEPLLEASYPVLSQCEGYDELVGQLHEHFTGLHERRNRAPPR